MTKFSKLILGLCCFSSIAFAANGYKVPKNVDVKNGEKLYVEKGCIGCHGEKGMASQDSTAPALNGQYAVYQVIQLEAFADSRHKYKRDSGNSAQMSPFAQALTKKEMWDVSVYLENIRETRVFPKEWWDKNKADIAWTKKYRRGACKSCHGQNYAGAYPSAPKLAGLQSKYLMDQMKHYSTGARRGAQAHHMKLLADFYSTKELFKISKNAESYEGVKNVKRK